MPGVESCAWAGPGRDGGRGSGGWTGRAGPQRVDAPALAGCGRCGPRLGTGLASATGPPEIGRVVPVAPAPLLRPACFEGRLQAGPAPGLPSTRSGLPDLTRIGKDRPRTGMAPPRPRTAVPRGAPSPQRGPRTAGVETGGASGASGRGGGPGPGPGRRPRTGEELAAVAGGTGETPWTTRGPWTRASDT